LFAAALIAACQPEAPPPPAPVPQPAPAAEEPAPDADKEVLVATEPAGAKVILKGAEVGTTPMKLLVRGNTNVVLEKEGYVKQALMITPESEPNMIIKLEPAGEGEAEAEVAPTGVTATAKKGGKGKKGKAGDEAATEDKPAETAAAETEEKPAETAPAAAPAPTPKKKSYTNMKQLKQDYHAGKITKADFAYWQSILKQKRAKEIGQLKADYKAGKITKIEYKQKANAIKQKYEG
jgi:hypothetical protein